MSNAQKVQTNAAGNTNLPLTDVTICACGGRVLWEGQAVDLAAGIKAAQNSGADLRRADLIKADLSGADLHRAHLIGTNLSGADLTDADLRGAGLSYANLTGADLSNADLSGANLTEANLSGANLSGANLTDADLRGADLTGTDLNAANLTGADLSNADLNGADLTEADLTEADLTEADLRGANLRGANLRDTSLNDAPIIQDIHRAVYTAAGAPGALDMRTWHCGTTHCRAGWVITLAGPAGAELENRVGTGPAAALIYLASDPQRFRAERLPDFHASNEDALNDMARMAGMQI